MSLLRQVASKSYSLSAVSLHLPLPITACCHLTAKSTCQILLQTLVMSVNYFAGKWPSVRWNAVCIIRLYGIYVITPPFFRNGTRRCRAITCTYCLFQNLKEVLAAKIPEHNTKVRAFRQAHNATKVGEVTLDQVRKQWISADSSLTEPHLGLSIASAEKSIGGM